jgi:hypothetical protein
MIVPALPVIRRETGTEHYFMCSTCMDVSTEITDPAYWRQRAEEARRMAEQLGDPVARQTLEDIAANCERLAELAEARRVTEKRD